MTKTVADEAIDLILQDPLAASGVLVVLGDVDRVVIDEAVGEKFWWFADGDWGKVHSADSPPSNPAAPRQWELRPSLMQVVVLERVSTDPVHVASALLFQIQTACDRLGRKAGRPLNEMQMRIGIWRSLHVGSSPVSGDQVVIGFRVAIAAIEPAPGAARLYGTFDEAQELMLADLAVPVIAEIAKAAAVPPRVRGGRERAAVSGRNLGKTADLRSAVARQAAEAFERAPTVGPAWMCIDAAMDRVRIAIGRGVPGLDPPAYEAVATPLAAAEVIAEIGRVCRPKNGFIDYSGFGLAHLRAVRAAWQQVGLAWVFTEVRS